MNELTLLVMAAGIGSRFGGLKQITPIDEEGNFLIDYSVYDAIQAGFKKVIFVIQKENYELFLNSIGKRIHDKIKVEYAFQTQDNIPNFIKIPNNRKKPFGTVHAILSAKEKINGPFAVINADDFYGSNAYQIVGEFLKKSTNYHLSVPYPFEKVDSKYGFVKRGVLSTDHDYVKDIIECSIGYENKKVIAKPLDHSMPFEIEKNHPVSMNLFGFQKEIIKDLEAYFQKFLIEKEDELEFAECFLPEFLKQSIQEGKIILKYQISPDEWLGITYQEDLEFVKNELKNWKKSGKYPKYLWK